MVKEVVWTIRASKTYWEVIEYLSTDFGEKVVSDFVTRVHNKIELISQTHFYSKNHLLKEMFL